MSFDSRFVHAVPTADTPTLFECRGFLRALQLAVRETRTLYAYEADRKGRRVLVVKPLGVVRPWAHIGVRNDDDDTFGYTWEDRCDLPGVPADGSIIGPVSDVEAVAAVILRVFEERP
ncbi:hypothetical protein [Spirillospora sp. CA-294931]|uniref:hypothetical protein n=1 Tax=Spirillospora sp. CA-294931 TaxID=3240042 RepID=UPI003D8FA3B5